MDVEVVRHNGPILMTTTRVAAVERTGNLVSVSAADGAPLPPAVVSKLRGALTYHRKAFVPRHDRRDFFGGGGAPYTFEERPMWREDAMGRLVCLYGHYRTVVNTLAGCGYSVELHRTDAESPQLAHVDMAGVAREFEFRPYQAQCLAAIAASDCGVIEATMGFGKGVIIEMVCRMYPRAVIHVTTRSADLVRKIYRGLSARFPDVGQVGAGSRSFGRVTVITADSLEYGDGQADILLGDEIHQLGAPRYAAALARYQHSRNFGFSASPEGRGDNADAEITGVFGPVIFRLTHQEAQAANIVLPVLVNWLKMDLPGNAADGLRDTAKYRHGVWRNKDRNRRFAAHVNTYPPDQQILVLVDKLEHAVYLRRELPDFTLCYSETALKDDRREHWVAKGLLSADEPVMTPARRRELYARFEAGDLKRVIATGVWSTGVDFRQLGVLVRADAGGSTILDAQAPGRVVRTYEGKSVGLVVDSEDRFDDGLRRKAAGRRKNYASKGWTQVTLDNPTP